MNLQSKKKKLLISDPLREKLYTTKQDSAKLFGQRGYIYLVTFRLTSLPFHEFSFLKGFLQILSLLPAKVEKIHSAFLCTLLFHVLTKLESKGRRKLWPKSFAKTFFSCAQCAISFLFTQKMKGKHAKTYKEKHSLIHSMHLLHH